MKSRMLFIMALLMAVGSLRAEPMPCSQGFQAIDMPQIPGPLAERVPPNYTFTRTPVPIMNSYYDYMIGSYNNLPLRVIPASAEGGYFLTYHGSRASTSLRRVFYTYLDASGVLINNIEINPYNIQEGYPSLAVDPLTGKPMYAWHANADTDTALETQFVADAFMAGISGLFNDIQVIHNNPITITAPNGTVTTDNQFIWPTAQVGPSPIAGKRRVYVLARNSVSHSPGESPNVRIGYADFDGDNLENGIPLVWSYTHIPMLDQWNIDQIWRQPFLALAVDNAGNLYYIGYHTTWDQNGYVSEEDIDVFRCDNYGQGTWSRQSFWGHLPTWNPPSVPGGNSGYFTNGSGVPYTNSQLFFKLMNSGHLNAGLDALGRIHALGSWALSNSDFGYYPELQFMKDLIYDPGAQQIQIREVYPRKDVNDLTNSCYTPWDLQYPYGQVDAYDAEGPVMSGDWPFPHWDATAHEDKMMLLYNNPKITNANSEGMMAAVWQSSQRARNFNYYSDGQYAAYANAPEICISVSGDNGNTWSDPIVLNKVDTPQFANLKPMWAYPADQIIYTGMQGNHRVGKLGLMFYDDNTWGANVISPPYHPSPDGGRIMFCELQIQFPVQSNPTDPFGTPLVLDHSMQVRASFQSSGVAAQAGDVLAAFVKVNNIPQLRGKATVYQQDNVSHANLNVACLSDDELVYFKLWDASNSSVYLIAETLLTQINGSVGVWPNDPFWVHTIIPGQQVLELQSGWNMSSVNVHPVNQNISNVFGGIMPLVQMIKCPDGIFVPNNPYNTLTDLTDGKGYFIRLSQPGSLYLNGAQMEPGTAIPLLEGWNLVGFTPIIAQSVDHAVSSLGPYLLQIKGAEGIYIPGNPYNTLNSLAPGRAYWMLLSQPYSLFYPNPLRDAIPQEILSCPQYGSPMIKPQSQAILTRLGTYAAEGDLLAAFAGDELRGLSPVKAVDNSLGSLIQVFTENVGEELAFRLLKAGSDAEVELLPGLSSAPGTTLGDYQSGSYLDLSPSQDITPVQSTRLISAYPNPFREGCAIKLQVAKDAPAISLEIYNLRGQKVACVYKGQLSQGLHSLVWSGLDDTGRKLGSGIYLCRLNTGKSSQNLKLMLVK